MWGVTVGRPRFPSHVLLLIFCYVGYSGWYGVLGDRLWFLFWFGYQVLYWLLTTIVISKNVFCTKKKHRKESQRLISHALALDVCGVVWFNHTLISSCLDTLSRWHSSPLHAHCRDLIMLASWLFIAETNHVLYIH